MAGPAIHNSEAKLFRIEHFGDYLRDLKTQGMSSTNPYQAGAVEAEELCRDIHDLLDMGTFEAHIQEAVQRMVLRSPEYFGNGQNFADEFKSRLAMASEREGGMITPEFAEELTKTVDNNGAMKYSPKARELVDAFLDSKPPSYASEAALDAMRDQRNFAVVKLGTASIFNRGVKNAVQEKLAEVGILEV